MLLPSTKTLAMYHAIATQPFSNSNVNCPPKFRTTTRVAEGRALNKLLLHNHTATRVATGFGKVSHIHRKLRFKGRNESGGIMPRLAEVWKPLASVIRGAPSQGPLGGPECPGEALRGGGLR